MLRLTAFALSVLCFAAALGQVPAALQAAPITPGDLVIYRVGDGAAALGTAAAPVFLDEYSPLGVFVQSIPLPSAGGSALTAVGNATTEGIISRSQDGQALVFTGYRKAAGGTSPASDTYLVTSRVVGTVTLGGVPDLSTTITNDNGLTSANTIRSATSVTATLGSPFWTSTSSRIGYDASGLGSAAGTTQIDARNSRQVNLADNVLYASNGSTAVTAKVQSYGVLPTGATAPSPVVSLLTTDAVNGFVLLDLDAGVAGADTLYALSTVEGQLRKYSFDGVTWTARGSVASGASNITADIVGGTTALFMTSGTTLSTLTDATGSTGVLAGTPLTLTTASTNTAFRGIGILLVPEPSTLGLLVGVGPLVLSMRRRRPM